MGNNNIKFDFFLIGAQKAATTSLYNYLIQHPEIGFSKVKELRYFIDDVFYQKGEKYLNLFLPENPKKVNGTSHVHMLPCIEAPARVLEYNSSAKLIILLRDPVKRAFSSFNYAKKNGWENKDITFSEAINLEDQRSTVKPINYDLLYFSNGLYYQHLTNWSKYFSKDKFLILTDNELRNTPDECLRKVFAFLDVPYFAIDTTKKFNVSSKARFSFLQTILIKRNNFRKITGNLIPTKLKVLIRSKIFPLIVNFNSVPTTSTETTVSSLSLEELENYNKYFEKDLFLLKEHYSIQL